jgi:hypothetical protein
MASYRDEISVLENLQKFYLDMIGDFSNFIQKNRTIWTAPVKNALIIIKSPVKAPLIWPKNSDSIRVSGYWERLSDENDLVKLCVKRCLFSS